MKRLILTSMLVTAGLVATACEAERREAGGEAVEDVDQRGIGGGGLREGEQGEEGILEEEPTERGEGVLREGEQEREGILREGEQEGMEREGVREND